MFTAKLTRWCAFAAISVSLIACQSTADKPATGNNTTKNPLSLERIYQEGEFTSQWLGRIRWLADGSGYTAVEKSATTKTDEDGKTQSIGKEIVFYDPNTLARIVLISAEQLTPKGEEKPLAINNYLWSDDRAQVLLYTNSKKVWRSNSRGDYWVLNLATNQLQQLGGKDVKASSLMFAKFSPDGSKVAYVADNNIYLETLSNNHISQLTSDAGNGIINGLFDWVYEEEFSIRDGFRWSPDGKSIAYWQLDTQGSKDFIMINNTDELYPTLTKFPYPKVGEQNALAKIGIVNLDSKKTVWGKVTE